MKKALLVLLLLLLIVLKVNCGLGKKFSPAEQERIKGKKALLVVVLKEKAGKGSGIMMVLMNIWIQFQEG